MTARAVFWIFIAVLLLHPATALKAGILSAILLFAYALCEVFDHRRANAAIKKVIHAIDEETHGWKTDPEDPTAENRGELSRLKLTGSEAILVNRVAQLLLEMERARLRMLP